MAFIRDNLRGLAYQDGFTLWRYCTSDSTGKVSAPGYFKAAADEMRVGDVIYINASHYNNETATAQFAVSALTRNAVAIGAMTPWVRAPQMIEDYLLEGEDTA